MEVQYKVGIIGLGKIAFTIDRDVALKAMQPSNENIIWSHVGAFSNHPKTKITAICDVNNDNIDSYKKIYGSIASYNDYIKMIESEELDIISICAPTELHGVIIKKVIENGYTKAIFCEKPMAFTYGEAEKIVELCKSQKIVFAVNYMRRWDENYINIKNLVLEEELGTLQSITAYGQTALLTNACHLIDIMLFIAGDPHWVCGDIQTDYVRKIHGKDDHGGVAFIKFKNESYGFLKATSKNADNIMFELDIMFSNGRLIIDEYQRKYEKWEFQKIYKGKKITDASYKKLYQLNDVQVYADSQRMLRAVDDLINCIGTKQKPKSSYNNAFSVLRVIQLIKKSFHNNNAVFHF